MGQAPLYPQYLARIQFAELIDRPFCRMVTVTRTNRLADSLVALSRQVRAKFDEFSFWTTICWPKPAKSLKTARLDAMGGV